MAFTIAFSHCIVRYYQIGFLYVKITFYVAGMLQDKGEGTTIIRF